MKYPNTFTPSGRKIQAGNAISSAAHPMVPIGPVYYEELIPTSLPAIIRPGTHVWPVKMTFRQSTETGRSGRASDLFCMKQTDITKDFWVTQVLAIPTTPKFSKFHDIMTQGKAKFVYVVFNSPIHDPADVATTDTIGFIVNAAKLSQPTRDELLKEAAKLHMAEMARTAAKAPMDIEQWLAENQDKLGLVFRGHDFGYRGKP